MARWEDENWVVKHPKEDECVCKDCVFRAEDRYVKGQLVCKGATLAMCKVFPGENGKWKDSAILFHQADCEYHVSEQEDDE